jgi:hypothetical protein
MRAKVILVFMIVLISLPSMLCPFVFSSASITICVAPSYVSVGVVEIFSVNIDIADVSSPGLFSYQVMLCFDVDCLEAIAAEMPDGHFLTPTTPSELFVVYPGKIDNTLGTVSFAATLLAPEEGKTGSGTLARVQFRAIAAGDSSLALADVILVDADANPTPANLENGNVNVGAGSGRPSIYISPRYKSVEIGETFPVSIKVANMPSPGLVSNEMTLCYNATCLEAIAAEMPDGHFLTPTTPGGLFVVHPGTIDNAAGTVWFAAGLLYGEDSKTGSGTIMTVQFRAIATGNITFQLEDVILVGPYAVQASPHVYESETDQSPVVTIVPEFSLPIILSTLATVALLTLLVWRRKQLWLK